MDALQEAEKALEISHSRVRPFGRKLFDLAKSSGKPVHLISDMYLPNDTVSRMLENAGYGGQFETLFLSCDHMCTKKSGNLYAVVLGALDIAPNALVHIGDNKTTDIRMAEAKGVRPFRWSSAIEWLRSSPAMKKIYSPRVGAGEKARSAIAGTTARGLFEGPLPKPQLTTLSGGDPYRLGYAVLGPLVTGYMLWLGREAARDKISDLYFMAREGWVLKEVFNRLHPPGSTTVNTHYLLGSRRAVRVAACRTKADVMALLAMPYDPGVALNVFLEGRFGLVLGQDATQRLSALGIPDPKIALDRSFDHRRMLCVIVNDYMDEILAHAAEERRHYLAYLAQKGLDTSDNPGIVDIGWKANIQGALGDLIGKRSIGYYYATVQESENWLQRGDQHRAFVSQSASGPISTSVAIQNRHLLEFMLCHSSRSLVAMQQSVGHFSPIYRKESDLIGRRKLIEPLHRGTIAFAHDFHNGFADLLHQIYIDPDLAENALTSLIREPHQDDAGLFLGQSFEDAVGGLPRKFVISPDRNAGPSQSVWREGRAVIMESGKIPSVVKPADRREHRQQHNEPPPIEGFFVRQLASKRKRAKYERDRDAFFEDSKSRLLRLYWKASQPRKTVQ